MLLIDKRRSNRRSSTVTFGAEAVVMNVRYWPEAVGHERLLLGETASWVVSSHSLTSANHWPPI
jgi:hypothetical protein